MPAKPRRLPASASSSSARPRTQRRRHQRGPGDRHVAADEARVGEDRQRRDAGLDPWSEQAPAQPRDQQRGDERHLRARERQHVIGPRSLERLLGAGIDLGAVAQHHRPDQAAFGPGRHRPLEDRTRALASGGRETPQSVSRRIVEPLHEPSGLAEAEGRDTGVEALGRPQCRPHGDPIAVEKARLRRVAADFHAEQPLERLGTARAAFRLGLENEQQAAVPEQGVTAQGARDPMRPVTEPPFAQAGTQGAGLEHQRLDRPRGGSERQRRRCDRSQGRASRACDIRQEQGQRGERQQEQRFERGAFPVGQQAPQTEGRGESKQWAAHRPRRLAGGATAGSGGPGRFFKRHTGRSLTTASMWKVLGNWSKSSTVSGR